jgi:hypothetical protein
MLANGQMIASLLLWLATVVAGAPDATRTSPVPEWAARFDEFMGKGADCARESERR